MKPKPNTKPTKTLLTGSALVLAATASVFAQQAPFSMPGTAQPPVPRAPIAKVATTNTVKLATNTAPVTTNITMAAAAPATNGILHAVEESLGMKIPDAIAKGKVNVNVRLRYEQVDQSNLPEQSYAPTIRTRVGYTTAPLHGFQAMVEGENTTVIGPEDNYNAAGSNNEPGRPVVADPPTTELNQAWLAYSYESLFKTKFGRQVINLDNHRFIGDVGWRQNQQTFDAVSFGSEPVEKLNLYYGYVWDVHRVFGDVSGLPATSPNHDFKSDSHFINAAYSGWKYGRFVGYSYLLDLDLDNGTAARYNNSCASYGGYFAGQAPVSDKISVDYRAEFAYQTDYADSTLDYNATYYNLEAGMSVKPVAFGAGYEVLGSGANSGAGGGRTGFKTPLATLHAFNGWDDVFLNTPANGLQDFYVYFQINLPAQIPVRFIYHKYDSDHGSGNYGQEYDVVASKKFGKYWTALLKYACYNGDDAPAAYTVNKFWAQVEFSF
jgi:hypothetical protein